MGRSAYDLVRLPDVVVDTATAAVFAVLVVVLPAILERQIGVYPLASDGVYSLALVAPLALRRVQPVGSFAVVSGLCLLQLWVIPRPMWSDVAFLVALATVARYGPSWARWSGLLVGLVGAVVGPLDWLGGLDSIRRREDLYPMFIALFAVLSAWILGDLRRTRADYVAELEARNVRLAAERDQQAVIAAAAERQRIAREMHDVVAHSLSVVVVQADGGRYLADRDPESAKRALETIAASARDALGDMRRLLGLLREDGEKDGWSPQPGVRDIATLVDAVRSSGLSVQLEIEGDPVLVDRATGLTLYRIVQESLTNAIRHAGPAATVAVRIRYDSHRARVVVSDDGVGPSGWPGRDGSGRGLTGMRERVELHGGTLRTRAGPEGGFEVEADLPLSQLEVR